MTTEIERIEADQIEGAERQADGRLPSKENIDAMVSRFLGWQLPESGASDLCVTDRNYKFARSGTNLLTADEAREMILHLLAPYDGFGLELAQG